MYKSKHILDIFADARFFKIYRASTVTVFSGRSFSKLYAMQVDIIVEIGWRLSCIVMYVVIMRCLRGDGLCIVTETEGGSGKRPPSAGDVPGAAGDLGGRGRTAERAGRSQERRLQGTVW